MAAEIPCAACSWTPERQNGCRYNSHVKLFYGVSDRGVWSIGSDVIVKERSDAPPNFEAQNIRFLQAKTTIPVPDIIHESTEADGAYIMIMKRVPGVTLKKAWPNLSEVDKDRIAQQTAEYLTQLRKIQSDRLQSLDDQPVYSAWLFQNGYGVPHGPLESDDQLWEEMAKGLQGVPDKARRRLRDRMPPAKPYTFTHGDLTNENVIVKDGNLSGIIDWEASGYFPVWWEFAATGIGHGSEDWDWKVLLRKHMDKHDKALEFWRDYYALSSYPNLGDRGTKLLRELECDD
ncbi:kinase-like domain-containing protein [Nemania sp. FL0916]|nr:kinase-like domain-containing protein [Nemania sp. FL0916]